jgi:hypothetical protein
MKRLGSEKEFNMYWNHQKIVVRNFHFQMIYDFPDQFSRTSFIDTL